MDQTDVRMKCEGESDTPDVYIETLSGAAKKACYKIGRLSVNEKNDILERAAYALRENAGYILGENGKDIRLAREKGIKDSLIDRILLDHDRIDAMASGLEEIARLEDPVGEVLSMKKRPNGLIIGQKRVPLGVVGIIYEARPNVTVDAFGLCFKTGNAVILKGGSDALHSNKAIVDILKNVLEQCGMPTGCLALVERTDRASTDALMRAHGLIDVLIPRGGAGLIKSVVENSRVPVIETGTGNCHIYVDKDADKAMAISVIENAKTQRMGVCNACESLVFHKDALHILPAVCECLAEHHIEIRGDERSIAVVPYIRRAAEEDWAAEYLDRIVSVKVADSLGEAIEHINRYNTGHSEAIITENYENAMRFHEEIDAAAVYINASTRFTDGFEFGFGAEIGISTQKLHARGPMGLSALTTTKYIIFGNGQIRS